MMLNDNSTRRRGQTPRRGSLEMEAHRAGLSRERRDATKQRRLSADILSQKLDGTAAIIVVPAEIQFV